MFRESLLCPLCWCGMAAALLLLRPAGAHTTSLPASAFEAGDWGCLLGAVQQSAIAACLLVLCWMANVSLLLVV